LRLKPVKMPKYSVNFTAVPNNLLLKNLCWPLVNIKQILWDYVRPSVAPYLPVQISLKASQFR
jgi:hypothetical protein